MDDHDGTERGEGHVMTHLDRLRAMVTDEWTVSVVDHDYGNDSRYGAAVERVTREGLTIRPKKPWASQGRGFSTMSFTWDDDQKEVRETTVDLFHTPPAHTGKSRRMIKSFIFLPPKGWRHG